MGGCHGRTAPDSAECVPSAFIGSIQDSTESNIRSSCYPVPCPADACSACSTRESSEAGGSSASSTSERSSISCSGYSDGSGSDLYRADTESSAATAATGGVGGNRRAGSAAAAAAAAAAAVSSNRAAASGTSATPASISTSESLWPVFDIRMHAHLDDSFTPTYSPSPLLQIEDQALKQQLRDRATNYVLAAMENCLQDRHVFRISYSPKYTDSAFEYRVVCLPLDHPFLQLPQPIVLNFAAAASAPHFVVAAAAVAGSNAGFLEAALSAANDRLQEPQSAAVAAASAAACTPVRLGGSGIATDAAIVGAAADTWAAAVAAERAAGAGAAAAAASRAAAASSFRAAIEGARGASQTERVAAAVREAAAAAAAAQAEAAAEEAPLAAAAVGMLFEKSLQLPEAAWRSLGIRMSKGWTHVGTSLYESNTFLFARPLETDGGSGVAPPHCVLRAQQQQKLKRRLLEAFAADALRAVRDGPLTPCPSVSVSGLLTPREGCPRACQKKRGSLHKQKQRKRQHAPAGCKKRPPWCVHAGAGTERNSGGEEDDPFAAFYAAFYSPGRPLKTAGGACGAEGSETAEAMEKDASFSVHQEHHQQQEGHADACAVRGCCRAPRGPLLKAPPCCFRYSLGVLGPLPPWAIPGVFVVYGRSTSRTTINKHGCSIGGFSCCCGRDAPLPGPLCSHHSGNKRIAAASNAAAAAGAGGAGDGDSIAHVSVIAGLQQQPPGSDGFERFLLELDPFQQQHQQQEQQQQQQRGVHTASKEALFSAVLRSPLLSRALALGGWNGVLPLSLQHLLLLLQRPLQQTSNAAKEGSLIVGHKAVALGSTATNGRRGSVAAIDAASGAALLKLEGEPDVIAVRCSETYLYLSLAERC